MKRRAVITGLGIVSPIGVGTEAFWNAAVAGRSGLSYPSIVDASKLPRDCHNVGEVKGFKVTDWMPGVVGKMAARFSQFAVAAAAMASADARLDEGQFSPREFKVSIGTAAHGLTDVHEPNFAAFRRGESVVPWMCLEDPAHAATSHVAIAHGVRGQTTTFATACAAGLDAIGWAAAEVEAGRAKAVLAGGTETPLSDFILMSFHSVGVLSKWQGPPEEASRPFERSRSGLVLAEGAAVVVVEDEEHARARGATIYARIEGFGCATEGVGVVRVRADMQNTVR